MLQPELPARPGCYCRVPETAKCMPPAVLGGCGGLSWKFTILEHSSALTPDTKTLDAKLKSPTSNLGIVKLPGALFSLDLGANSGASWPAGVNQISQATARLILQIHQNTSFNYKIWGKFP